MYGVSRPRPNSQSIFFLAGSSFRLERESAKGYFGSKDQSKVSSPLFSGGGKANVGSENTPILDELSKNPLFARERDRSKSPAAAAVETNNETNQRKSPLFAKEGSKSPVAPERKMPIRYLLYLNDYLEPVCCKKQQKSS